MSSCHYLFLPSSEKAACLATEDFKTKSPAISYELHRSDGLPKGQI